MLDTKDVLQVLPALKQVAPDKAPTVFTSPKEVIEYAKAQKLQIVDLKFVDLPGTWQHFSIPITELEESLFNEGIGFDGSSIRGFQAINESDMLLILDPTTATTDPVCNVPTLTVTASVFDPITREPYTRDPRHIARKAEKYLAQTGIATMSYWGPEAEFFIFDNVRFDQNSHSGYYFIDSDEGVWNSGRDQGTQNLGHRPRYKEGYFPVPPADALQDIRSEIILRLINANVPIEVHHHEVATAGQCEIDMHYGPLVTMADRLMMYQVRDQKRRALVRQNGDLHAQAAFPGQWVRHARSSKSLEGRHQSLRRREWLCRAVRDGKVLYRRAVIARAGTARAVRPDDEFVSAFGAGV